MNRYYTFYFVTGTHWADVVSGKKMDDPQNSPSKFGFAPVVHPAYNYSPSQMPSPSGGFAIPKSPSMPGNQQQHGLHLRSSQSDMNIKQFNAACQFEGAIHEGQEHSGRSRSSSRDGPVKVSFHLDSDDPGFGSNSSDSGQVTGRSPQSYAEVCQHCNKHFSPPNVSGSARHRYGSGDSNTTRGSRSHKGKPEGRGRGRPGDKREYQNRNRTYSDSPQQRRYHHQNRGQNQDGRKRNYERWPSSSDSQSSGTESARRSYDRGRPPRRGHRGRGYRGRGRGSFDRDDRYEDRRQSGTDYRSHGNRGDNEEYNRSYSDSSAQRRNSGFSHTNKKSYSSPHTFENSESMTASMEGRVIQYGGQAGSKGVGGPRDRHKSSYT